MKAISRNLREVVNKEWGNDTVPTRISIRRSGDGALISVLAETTYMTEEGRVNFADVVETPGEPPFVLIKTTGNREVKPGRF